MLRTAVSRMARQAWTSAALALVTGGAVSAAVVPLGSVTATYDQGGGYEVAKMIDGNLSGGQGWAVFNGQFTPQTAIMTTLSPVSTPQLAFELGQYAPNFAHNINQFRISATNDPSPSAGSTWTPLNITGGAAEATLFKLPGNAVLARDNAAPDNYQLRAQSPFNGITGFRLEVLPFDYNPTDALAASLGRSDNGNFVLSEFTVYDSPTGLFKNVARGLSTTQSTNGFGFDGAPAVDGIIGGGNITHTNTGDIAPFWEVSLEANTLIDNVVIYNRDNCCPERFYNMRVEIRNAADAVVYTSPVLNPVDPGGTPTDPGQRFVIDLPGAGVNGTKVRVTKDANAGVEWMSLSEVQVNVPATFSALNSLGDFNEDGLVNLGDFDILRNNFREGTEYGQGDINFDGEIDLNDFATFVEAYKFANPGSPVPNGVPEPSTWALVAVGSIFLGVARKRRARG